MKRVLIATAAAVAVVSMFASAGVSASRGLPVAQVAAHRLTPAQLAHLKAIGVRVKGVSEVIRVPDQPAGLAPAATQTTCAGGDLNYAGYLRNSIPADGGYVFAGIVWNSGSVIGSGSHLSGWVGSENTSVTHFVRAGIWEGGGYGLITFIEISTDATGQVFYVGASVNPGTAYGPVVTKNSAGNWTAQIGTLKVTGIPLNGATTSMLTGESYTGQAGAQCNVMNFSFSNSFPWSTGTMTKIQDAPYTVSNVTGNGWKSSGS